jgi:hypothetical protein
LNTRKVARDTARREAIIYMNFRNLIRSITAEINHY